MDPVWKSIILAVLLSIIPLTIVVLAPKIITAAGRTIGWYLQHKTDGRRAHILERVDSEEKALAADEGSRKNSDEEWENVEAHTVGSAKNGEKVDREWDGIVGFFHPFWYSL
jgi:alpha-1,2-mannosyltransferase